MERTRLIDPRNLPSPVPFYTAPAAAAPEGIPLSPQEERYLSWLRRQLLGAARTAQTLRALVRIAVGQPRSLRDPAWKEQLGPHFSSVEQLVRQSQAMPEVPQTLAAVRDQYLRALDAIQEGSHLFNQAVTEGDADAIGEASRLLQTGAVETERTASMIRAFNAGVQP